MSTKSNNPTLIKFGIVCIALVNSGNMPLVPALGAISEAMPDTSPILIQSLLSIQCLFIGVAPIWYAKLVEIIPKLMIMRIGMLTFILAGLAPYFFYENIYIILFFRALVGIGNGIGIVVAMDFVVDFFDGGERDTMQGALSASANISGIIYQVISGFAIQSDWRNAFLVYILGFVWFIIANIFVPEPNRVGKIEKLEGDKNVRAKLNPRVIIFAALTIVLFIVWMTGVTNMSIVLTDENMGTTGQIGLTTSLMSVGGFVSAFLFGRIQKRLHHYSLLFAYILATAGFFVLYFAHNLVFFAVGAALVGATLGIGIPSSITKVTEMVPYSAAPKAISTITFSVGVGQFLQPLIYGMLGDIGYGRPGFLLSGCAMIVLSLILIIVLKKL